MEEKESKGKYRYQVLVYTVTDDARTLLVNLLPCSRTSCHSVHATNKGTFRRRSKTAAVASHGTPTGAAVRDMGMLTVSLWTLSALRVAIEPPDSFPLLAEVFAERGATLVRASAEPDVLWAASPEDEQVRCTRRGCTYHSTLTTASFCPPAAPLLSLASFLVRFDIHLFFFF